VKGGHLSRTEADLAVEQAVAAESKRGTHDPRIEKTYRRDVITIYTFVIALWITLWAVFFFVVNPNVNDNALRWLMIGLGIFASVFNATGMIQNTRRLKQEAIRFYSQDLFWQDQKKLQKEFAKEEHEAFKRQRNIDKGVPNA
jgi:O-antigen/teichoic acid export membrane protein